MARMRYFGNTHDPRDPHADMYIVCGFHEDPCDAVARHATWLSNKLIGDPQGTEAYSSAELREQGMVGVYSYEIDEYATEKEPDKCIVDYDGPFYSNRHAAMCDRPEHLAHDRKVCSDCKGKGIYEGFNRLAEPCARCNGSGKE